MKKPLFDNYGKGKYLESGKDMAHYEFDPYEVGDEIHIVYKNGNVATEKM